MRRVTLLVRQWSAQSKIYGDAMRLLIVIVVRQPRRNYRAYGLALLSIFLEFSRYRRTHGSAWRWTQLRNGAALDVEVRTAVCQRTASPASAAWKQVAHRCAPFHPVLDPHRRWERLQRRPLGQPTYLAAKVNGDNSMLVTLEEDEDVESAVLLDPRDMVRAELPEPQVPVMQCHVSRYSVYRGTIDIGRRRRSRLNLWVDGRCSPRALKEPTTAPPSRSHVKH